MFYLDIWEEIGKHADFLTKVKLRSLCREIRSRVKIEIIDASLNHRVTNKSLKYFPDLKTLEVIYNPHITDAGICHLKLETLVVINSDITNLGIRGMDLRNLVVRCFDRDITVDGTKHMKNLKHCDIVYTVPGYIMDQMTKCTSKSTC